MRVCGLWQRACTRDRMLVEVALFVALVEECGRVCVEFVGRWKRAGVQRNDE